MSTPFLDQVYEVIDFDREIVFKFFTVFSLFEYALKQSSKFRTYRKGKLEANWKKFAEDIHPTFYPENVRESVNYFLNHPPMKQVLVNGFIDYEETDRDETNDTVWLSILIRRVRNNLFHGGKFGYRPERDTPLIVQALEILETWSHCDSEVERALTIILNW